MSRSTLSVLCGAFLMIKGEPKLVREACRCIKLCLSHHLETRPGWNCPSSAGHHMNTGITDPTLAAATRAGLSSRRRSLLNQTMEHAPAGAAILRTCFPHAYSSQLLLAIKELQFKRNLLQSLSWRSRACCSSASSYPPFVAACCSKRYDHVPTRSNYLAASLHLRPAEVRDKRSGFSSE